MLSFCYYTKNSTFPTRLFIIFIIFWVLAHKLLMLLLNSIINQVSNHKC